MRALSLVLLLGACGGHQHTVEAGGETAIDPTVSSAEVRIDRLLETLHDAVERGDGSAFDELSDTPGRSAIARFVVGRGQAILRATEGTEDAQRMAFLVGALFGAHAEPDVAAPVNHIGLALLRASGHADEDRAEWLFPNAVAAESAPPLPETLVHEALERGIATQRRGSFAGLDAAGFGNCTRGTYLQSFELAGAFFGNGAAARWASDVDRIWVARLDCMAEVGLFLFSEGSDREIRLLGFRFLTEEAHRDALEILESLNPRVEPEAAPE